MNMTTEYSIERSFEESAQRLAEVQSLFNADNFCLLGAGNMGRWALSELRKVGVEPAGFIDNTPAKLGTVIDGLPVLGEPPGADTSVVVCVHNPAHQYLDTRARFGDRTLSFLHLPWLFPTVILGHGCHPEKYAGHLKDIVAVHAGLADESSKRTFLEQLRFRLTLDWRFQEHTEVPYFPSDIGFPFSERFDFVDAGAYDGDTVRLLIKKCPNVGRVLAIEADPRNFAKLETYLSTTGKDHLAYNAAVGGQEGILHFDATGDMAARLSSSGGTQVRCHTLDYFMREVNDPCYIKFDVEGAEREILMQAESLLRSRRPMLAVSVYHHPLDMIELPLFLQNIGYRTHLRYHGIDGADLVLYAIQ
jgi:FkbM family methyltransferase